jgi:Family of unknown function (DUF5681)
MAEKQRKNSDRKAKRLANLKPFKKGESGNPAGRPEGSLNRGTTLKKWLYGDASFTNPLTLQKAIGTVEDHVILALLKRATAGNIPAIKEVLDSVYGKNPELLTADVDVNMLSPEEFKKRAAERRKQVESLDD